MGIVAEQLNIDQVWAIGDNFYYEGVVDEYDPRFNETFENIFNASSLENIPFYVVAGNHDWQGNVTGEIFYSNHSNRWTFPNYWYNVVFDIPGTEQTLELLMTDSVLLSGQSYQDEEYCKLYDIPLDKCSLYPSGPDPEHLEMSQQQLDFIHGVLNSSTANYLIVAGHYPIWSVAEHGSTQYLIQELNPWLIQYNVTAYVSGHDHTFEYIYNDNIGYVDTGGTHVCTMDVSHNDTIPSGSLKFHGCENGGFSRLSVDENGLKFYYYFGNDTNPVYETNTFQPRF